MKDPYLIKGWPCEITWNGLKFIRYFLEIENGKRIIFTDIKGKPYGLRFKDYRPIGTEWDFAPKWVVCSTVNNVGTIVLWDTTDIKPFSTYWNNFNLEFKAMICGVCSDKSRYEGDAWKTSLRMRPVWAK